MRWINKRIKKNRKKAHKLLGRFFLDSWNKDLHKYVNGDFDALKRCKAFKTLLYREQVGYCCYCMRKLDPSDKVKMTIEHVMPHRVTEADCAYYYAHVPHLYKNVRIADNLNQNSKLRGRPYPHFCAYENLVLSCSGAIYRTDVPDKEQIGKLHECCNNSRGNRRVEPLFYNKSLNMIYERNGSLTFAPEYEDTIRVLKLESNDNLRLLRKAWACVVRLYSIADVELAMTDRSLRENILSDALLSLSEVKRLRNDLYWQLFYDYRWFGGYFINADK